MREHFSFERGPHGGGSSSGAFLWSLTLTDFHSGWTELAALWGNSGGEVRVGLERIEKRLPFPMLGFDCDNGSEFLNKIVEAYLLRRNRSVEWTRSRASKKNDQAHVEQKNFTHVRQLLGAIRGRGLGLAGDFSLLRVGLRDSSGGGGGGLNGDYENLCADYGGGGPKI